MISRFDEVDIAIVGIGILEPSQLLKTSGNYYHEDMLQVLAERGAVGDICLHYYDKTGRRCYVMMKILLSAWRWRKSKMPQCRRAGRR